MQIKEVKMIIHSMECFNCKHYRAYYSREFCNLFRERFGRCENHCKIVKENDFCDEWRKRRISSAQHISLAISAIDQIHEKISIVEQMLKEEIAIEKLNKEIKD